MSDIRELTEKIKKFRDERDWKQFHNHKDMALSLKPALYSRSPSYHFFFKKRVPYSYNFTTADTKCEVKR